MARFNLETAKPKNGEALNEVKRRNLDTKKQQISP